jgi:hypothetical protein
LGLLFSVICNFAGSSKEGALFTGINEFGGIEHVTFGILVPVSDAP